jgi:hypothetical protein
VTQERDRNPQQDRGQRQARLSEQVQQQRIQQQQQQIVQYRQHLDQDRARDQERSSQLQQQNRNAQYRFQQDYLQRMRQQQINIDNDRRNHNYNNDPYFYTASSYRYNRGGNYYETNQYGARLLRQALNYGYSEGFRAGRADRLDRWRSSYQDSYIYQDANYGYNGYYVDQDSYNYYFREGFRRGYEDGFNGRYQYGRYSNGAYIMLGPLVIQILDFQDLR